MTIFRNVQAELTRFRLRIFVAALVMVAGFVLLGARLFYLQVVRHDDLFAQAENNRTAVVPLVPTRGLIMDRNGLVLASNYAAYTLEVTPSKVDDLEASLQSLSDIIEITPRDHRRFKKLREESKSFGSVPLRNRLSDAEVARFAANRYRFAGLDVKARLFRNYPYGETASHVIGYIGRINASEKEQLNESDEGANYRGTDHIGKLGIEQSFESRLHGTTGFESIETSAGGHAVRRLSSLAATPGDTIKLSLDIKLQKLVEDLYGERRGALVALDPNNGEVLALVSKPTFDINLFIDGIDQESWQGLNESPDKPLLNRALRGTYPPGSTYKPFMALAALKTGKRAASTTIDDQGFFMFGGRRFGSPENELGGIMDMHRAIVESSNVYFYTLANEMGVQAIHDFMAPLGFGQVTGIDLKGEVSGVLPSPDWKRRYYKRAEQQKWFAGETISLGIGQGYNSFTMLQLAQATATVANGGIRHQPHLAMSIQDTVKRTTQELLLDEPIDLGFKPEHITVIRKAMVDVARTGTSARAFAGAAYDSAGKTGTAQAVSLGKNEKYSAIKADERKRDHALYIAFAPADQPKIALAAIVENAGFGSASAAPIARRVFDYWLLGLYPNDFDMQAMRAGTATAPIGTPLVAADLTWPTGSGPPTAQQLTPLPVPFEAPTAPTGTALSKPTTKPTQPGQRP